MQQIDLHEVPNILYQHNQTNNINMNHIVGQHDILFLCFDSLRYDVAKQQEQRGHTPVISAYAAWEPRQASGNFTWPAHHAMFSGFLPLKMGHSMNAHEMLFFPKDIGLGRKAPKQAFAFEGTTIMAGLADVGYETICIGGVAFFNKRSAMGRVFPAMFTHSYWQPRFSCTEPDSTRYQVDFAIKILQTIPTTQRIMMYINFTAIHYPNHFYLEGAKKDDIDTHAAALQYIDRTIAPLLTTFQQRNPTFVIACSDHGTCYGEGGYYFHGMNNDIVNVIPYKEFIL